MQVPAVSMVTVLPLMLHTDVVTGTLKVTALPEAPPVAETAKLPPVLNVTGPGLAPKVMVWLVVLMVMLCVTCGAAL